MDTMLSRSAEMGVADVIPIVTGRIYKDALEMSKKENITQRWNNVANALTKNCLREVSPVVHETMSFAEAIEVAREYDVAVLCYENECDPNCTAKALVECKNAKSVIVFVGCEEGFTEEEVELAKSKGVEVITLGKRIICACNASAIFMGMLTYILELSEGETND